jgi:hypothetical protein
MQRLLLICAAFGVSAAPALTQSAPGEGIPDQVVSNAANQQATVAPAPQPKMMKKRVCENVEVERSTGSRLNSTTKICKTIEVPVPASDGQPPAAEGSTERH